MSRLLVMRPSWLILLLALPGVWAAWRRWPPPLSTGRSRLVLAVRLVLVALVVLALADVRLGRQPRHRATIAVVDLSDSARTSQGQAAAAVVEMIEAKRPEDLFGLVTFGRDAQVEVPPSVRPRFLGFQTRPDPSYSDLAGAMGLAANLVPDGYARQVVLISDGRENLGNSAEAVEGLRERSVRVDVVSLGARPGEEALVVALEAPYELRVGQRLVATARLRSTVAGRGQLTLTLDGRQVEARNVDLAAGDSEQRFEIEPLEPGPHRLAVQLDATPDGYSQNDVAEAVVRVVDRPAVLVLEGSPGEGANVASAAEAAGMRVERRPAQQSPTTTAGLASYDAVVVAGAPVDAFPAGALAAIASAVRDLGRGLVAIGGPAAYGPGGWAGTPLEEALPVRMEVPRPKERPAIAVAVVIETMEDAYGDLTALGSVDAIVDQLKPDDEIAVVRMHQQGPSYIVPLTRPVDKVAIKQQVRFATLGDPPGYADSVVAGLDALAESAAANKHLILVGDGDATADLDRYQELFAGARSDAVTVSSIGVATHRSRPDMDHMRAIASLGGGRFYESGSGAEIARFMLEVGRSVLKPWYEQTPFFPKVTSTGDLLDGVALDAFPELGGYVATTPKPTSDVLLSSPKDDPLLAAASHGLGRSVAWTSDAQGRWTAGLLSTPVSSSLFGRMVTWALPTSDLGAGSTGVRLDAVPRGDGLDVTVSGPVGGDLDLRMVPPEGPVQDQELSPVGPGRWQGTLSAPEVGHYLLRAAVRRDGAVLGQAELAVAVPYAAEYLELGLNDGLLTELVRKGGTRLDRAAAAWLQPTPPIVVTSPAFWFLLLGFAVVWPFDVALRRLTISPRQVLARWRANRADRRTSALEPEVNRGGPVNPDRAPPPIDADSVRRRAERKADRRVPTGDRGVPPVPEPAMATRLLEAKRSRGNPN